MIKSIAIFFALLTCVFCYAQDATVKPVQEEVSVSLDQIAFRLADPEGRWISGITKEEVELILNGEGQAIEYLDEIQSDEFAKRDGVSSTPFANAVIFVLDSSSARPQTLSKHKDEITKLAGSFPKSYHLGLVALSPAGMFQTLQDLTQDRTRFLSVVSNVEKQLQGGAEEWEQQLGRLMDTSRLEECQGQRRNYTDCAQSAVVAMAQNAKMYSRVLQSKGAAGFESFRRLISSIAKVPGNKTIVVVSQGIDPLAVQFMQSAKASLDQVAGRYGFSEHFRQTVLRDFEADTTANSKFAGALKSVSDVMGAASISLYWIRASRSGGADMWATALGAQAASSLSSQMVLKALADQTGGAAYLGKDMNNSYANLLKNLVSYYLVSYKSDANKAQVVEAIIRIKKGNREISLLRKPLVKGDLRADASYLKDASGALSMKTEVNYFQRKENEFHVLVAVGVPYLALKPEIKSSKIKDQLFLTFKVFDEGGKEVFQAQPKVPVETSTQEFFAMQQQNAVIEYLQRFNLKNGKYRLSITAKESQSQATSSTEIPVILHASAESCPRISPVMLASAIHPSGKLAENPEITKDGEILYGDRAFQLATTRVFGRSGVLDGFYQIYSAQQQPLMLIFKLHRGTTFVNQTQPRPVQTKGQKLISEHFSVPYKNLEEGEYTLEVMITTPDSRCTASSQTGFLVAETAKQVSAGN